MRGPCRGLGYIRLSRSNAERSEPSFFFAKQTVFIGIATTTAMSTKEAQDQLKREGEGALSTSEYWDLRYAQADGENATHEWFRSFSTLLPFLQSNLFDVRPVDQKPKILHFGSGDSVSW